MVSDPVLDAVTIRSDFSEPDSVLATYVGQMDRLSEPVDPGIPLILSVGGLLVQGELIPQWQWFLEVSELNNHEDAFYVGMAEHVKELSDLAHSAVRLRDTGGEISHRQYLALMSPTKYIHLRNARVLLTDVAQGHGRHWRGRLSEVTGWTPGSGAVADS